MANAVSRQSQHQPRHRMGYINVPQAQQEEEVQSARTQSPSNDHLTKSGQPDRRFSEYRFLPPPEEEAETRARTGEIINGVHYTIDGKVDRRFVETRGLSDQEVAQLELEYLQMKTGK